MLYFHCYDKDVVSAALLQVQARIGEADTALLALKKDLLSSLGAGSVSCDKAGVPVFVRLLAIRKEAQQLCLGTDQEPLVLVYDDSSHVPEKFADLGPTFEMFGSSLDEAAEEAGEVGFIPPKLDLRAAFGLTSRGAETASWF